MCMYLMCLKDKGVNTQLCKVYQSMLLFIRVLSLRAYSLGDFSQFFKGRLHSFNGLQSKAMGTTVTGSIDVSGLKIAQHRMKTNLRNSCIPMYASLISIRTYWLQTYVHEPWSHTVFSNSQSCDVRWFTSIKVTITNEWVLDTREL